MPHGRITSFDICGALVAIQQHAPFIGPSAALPQITNGGPGGLHIYIFLRFDVLLLYAPAAITITPSKNSYRRLFVSHYALQLLLQLVTLFTVCFYTLLRLSLSLTSSSSSCPGLPPYLSIGIHHCQSWVFAVALPCLAVR